MVGLPHKRQKRELTRIIINVYEDEKPIIKKEANSLGLTVSEYIRRLLEKERNSK